MDEDGVTDGDDDIYLDSSLFCEQSALVVDVIDQRFEAIVSLGDPGAREGICATDICL